MADRIVFWNRFIMPALGVGAGLGGAMSGLSKGLTVSVIIGACAVLLGGEFLLLKAKE